MIWFVGYLQCKLLLTFFENPILLLITIIITKLLKHFFNQLKQSEGNLVKSKARLFLLILTINV